MPEELLGIYTPCPKQRQEAAMHVIRTGRLLVTNPGNYQLTFAEVAYRPTGSTRALGMLLFALKPSVVYFDAEQNPVKFLDECIRVAQELHLLVSSARNIPAADRISMASLLAETTELAPDGSTAAVARKMLLKNLGPNWSRALSQNS